MDLHEGREHTYARDELSCGGVDADDALPLPQAHPEIAVRVLELTQLVNETHFSDAPMDMPSGYPSTSATV